MSQTAVNAAPSVGRVGFLSSNAEKDAVAKIASVAIPFGCLVTRDADDLKAKLPTSAAEVLAGLKSGGVAIGSHAIVSDPNVTLPTFPIGKEFAALRKGRIWVKVEEAVAQGDQAYARYANGIGTTDGTQDQKGAFRKSYDGTAQVATLTPTAANATIYAVEILDGDGKVLAAAEYLSDGSGTATEICDGLRAALGTVSGFVLSGTSTLIITASVAGVPFSVKSIGDGVIAVAATTANAKSAEKCPGCYYKSSASAGALAELEVNMGGN